MKSLGNLRLQLVTAGMQMLSRLSLGEKQIAQTNKILRQQRRKLHMSGYSRSGSGARECARRRRQMAYDREIGHYGDPLRLRRALMKGDY